MLHVTPRARSELHGMLVRALAARPREDDADLGFRLVAGGEGERSGLGLALDGPRDGDEVLEHEGRVVLLVDRMVSDLVGDVTLDAVDTPEGVRLGLREERPPRGH